MIWFALLSVALGALATGFVIGCAYGVARESERQEWLEMARKVYLLEDKRG